MSTSDPRTPPDAAAPAPAWGTAPGAAGGREPAPSAPGPAAPAQPAAPRPAAPPPGAPRPAPKPAPKPTPRGKAG